MRAFFVTGTDTGVGKTLVSTSLAAYFSRTKGLSVGVMKPFETGLPTDRTEFFPCDAKSLKEASGTRDDLSVVNPCTFKLPLAPEAAAIQDGKEIDLEMVKKGYERIAGSHDVTIVEGAGGILVPIKDNFFFQDLIREWALPVVVVARLGLGTINHTLLTCRSLQSAGIKIIGVVMNDTDNSYDEADKTNPDMLKKYLTVPVLGAIPYLKEQEGQDPDFGLLARIAAGRLKADLIYDGAILPPL
jgi:dethiobiotin synthetase